LEWRHSNQARKKFKLGLKAKSNDDLSAQIENNFSLTPRRTAWKIPLPMKIVRDNFREKA
jgi:hypothetical protein